MPLCVLCRLRTRFGLAGNASIWCSMPLHTPLELAVVCGTGGAASHARPTKKPGLANASMPQPLVSIDRFRISSLHVLCVVHVDHNERATGAHAGVVGVTFGSGQTNWWLQRQHIFNTDEFTCHNARTYKHTPPRIATTLPQKKYLSNSTSCMWKLCPLQVTKCFEHV